jgi:Ca2+-binding RTX toxin-like protein
MATLTGTPGNDTLHGTSRSDLIWLLAGNDLSDGGAGNDTIRGDKGNDTLRGGAGNDLVAGQMGNDDVNGGAGNDTLKGDLGNDTVRGDSGNDIIYGGDGNDLLAGQQDDDHVYGEAGNDTVKGDLGNDTLDGGAGNDTIIDSAGTTSEVHGGAGEDHVTVDMKVEDDESLLLIVGVSIHGDDGNDTIITAPVAMATIDELDQYPYDRNPTSAVLQTIHGGYGNDTIEVYAYAKAHYDDYTLYSSTKTHVFGDDGDDDITVRQRSEGEDRATVYAGRGNDNVLIDHTGVPQTGVFEVHGGPGDDTCTVNTIPFMGDEGGSNPVRDVTVFGDDGADTITITSVTFLSTESTNYVTHVAHGGADNDVITATGRASVYNDFGVNVGLATNQLYGDDGDDAVTGIILEPIYDGTFGTGQNLLFGGDGDDVLIAIGGEDNVLDGGAGDDTLTGSDNDDTFVLRVGDGTDTITNFQQGTDSIGLADGLGYGDLTIVASAGDTTILAGAEELAVVENVIGITSADFVLV